MRQPLSQEIETIRFPMSKNEAKERQNECRMMFNDVLSRHKKTDALQIYTDGSSDPQKETATCAFWIPQLNTGQSWTLRKGSSIFTAELFAIYKALQYIYSLDRYFEELLCISDSSSAISTISQSSRNKHPIVAEISNLIACLTNSGTKSTLLWVPSHTGIPGNEIVDQMALAELQHPTKQVINNKLSVGELWTKSKRLWTKEILSEWNTYPSASLQRKKQLRSPPWFFSRERNISKCLHRLRTGHSNLKNHSYHYHNTDEDNLGDQEDEEPDRSCRYGCNALEDAQHVLMDCSKTENQRRALMQGFRNLQVELNVENLLGLNTDLNSRTQFKIHKLVSAFIKNSNLITII